MHVFKQRLTTRRNRVIGDSTRLPGPRSPLDPPRNWQERWVVFSPFSFFSFVFRPAPSRSIKIRPVSRDVDAFSEAGWALPVRPGERGGIPHRRRVRETRGRARAIPMRTPAQVLSALAAIALSHGAKVHVAPRRITIVLCCASPLLFPLLLPPPPPSSSSLPTLLSPLLLPCIFLLYFSLSFSFPLLRVPCVCSSVYPPAASAHACLFPRALTNSDLRPRT